MEKTETDVNVQVETENSNEINELERIKELLDIAKEENAKLKSDLEFKEKAAKEAFQARDRIKQKLRETESNKSSVDVSEFEIRIKQMEEERDSLKSQIELIQKEKEKETKLEFVKQLAKEAGIKDNYINKIDKFLSLEDIRQDKPNMAKTHIENLKKEYPDFFGTLSKDLDHALPAPNLKDSGTMSMIDQLKKEYAIEVKKGLSADFDKLEKLKMAINEA